MEIKRGKERNGKRQREQDQASRGAHKPSGPRASALQWVFNPAGAPEGSNPAVGPPQPQQEGSPHRPPRPPYRAGSRSTPQPPGCSWQSPPQSFSSLPAFPPRHESRQYRTQVHTEVSGCVLYPHTGVQGHSAPPRGPWFDQCLAQKWAARESDDGSLQGLCC